MPKIVLSAGQRGAVPDARVAALAFQGMTREALYTKCISRSPGYRDLALTDLCDQLVDLFLQMLRQES